MSPLTLALLSAAISMGQADPCRCPIRTPANGKQCDCLYPDAQAAYGGRCVCGDPPMRLPPQAPDLPAQAPPPFLAVPKAPPKKAVTGQNAAPALHVSREVRSFGGPQHSHLCPKCGTEWWHTEGVGDYRAAHTCPNCGTFVKQINRQGRPATAAPVRAPAKMPKAAITLPQSSNGGWVTPHRVEYPAADPNCATVWVNGVPQVR
jgi:predicted RNA-binding Zn-ribbon protein involved in translation (DUF1610 family)